MKTKVVGRVSFWVGTTVVTISSILLTIVAAPAPHYSAVLVAMLGLAFGLSCLISGLELVFRGTRRRTIVTGTSGPNPIPARKRLPPILLRSAAFGIGVIVLIGVTTTLLAEFMSLRFSVFESAFPEFLVASAARVAIELAASKSSS